MKKIFDLILVPLFVIIFLSILIVGQNNKIALIIAGWCMGMQTILLIDGVKKCVKDHKRCLYKFGKK